MKILLGIHILTGGHSSLQCVDKCDQKFSKWLIHRQVFNFRILEIKFSNSHFCILKRFIPLFNMSYTVNMFALLFIRNKFFFIHILPGW